MNDTLLAAFIAAFLTVFGTYGIDRYKYFVNIKQQKLSILSALIAELSSLRILIEDRRNGFEMVKAVFPPTTLAYIPVSYNYFSIFDNLSAEIGLLNTPETVTLVISTYTEIKGLFDNLKDLGNKAQILHNLSITSGVSQETIKAVKDNQIKMQEVLLSEQVPKMINLIDYCVQTLKNEKEIVRKLNFIF